MNKEIVGKNLLDKEPILTGNGLPKIIGITENQYYKYEKLQQENNQLKEHIEKYEHYCKTTGIEELMQENQKYKEVIDKAIEYIEYVSIDETYSNVLLEILKGDNNENSI